MNDARRLCLKGEVDILAAMRVRLRKMRDDEDRISNGKYGEANQEVTDLLSEAGLVLLVAIDKLNKAKR